MIVTKDRRVLRLILFPTRIFFLLHRLRSRRWKDALNWPARWTTIWFSFANHATRNFKVRRIFMDITKILI